MRVFRAQRGGAVQARLDAAPRTALVRLANEMLELLEASTLSAPPDRSAPLDPAVQRLVPDAYPHDPEASVEFRRLTQGDVLDAKRAHATAIRDAFDTEGDSTVLDASTAQSVLRGLTDLRLVLAERLDIHEDGDEGRTDADSAFAQQLYWLLGALQEDLVDALSR